MMFKRLLSALLAAVRGLCVSLVTLLILLAVLELGMRLFGLGKPATNLQGFDRSPVRFRAEPERQHPWSRDDSNPLRIAVIGDSVSNGAGVSKDDTFAYRLERFLNMNAGLPPVEVRLYAKGGTSTYQQLDFLELALRHHPDLVILGICLNDTEDWTRSDQLREWRDDRLPRVPPPALAAVLRHSRFLHWAYRRLEARRSQYAYLRHHQRLFDPAYSGWRNFRLALVHFARRCRQSGAQPVAILFPDFAQANRTPYPLQPFHDQIHDALRKVDMPCLDLLDDFRGKDPYRLQAVPGIDGHPNEIAHRIIAESLLQFLAANEYIDPAYIPRSRSGSEQKFWEAVAARLNDPADASSAPSAPPPLDESLDN